MKHHADFERIGSEYLVSRPSPQLIFIWLIFALGICGSTFAFATPYMGIAATAYALLVGGLIWRKDRVLHAGFMNAGIGLDIALVLVLEFQRQAIGTAMAMTMGPAEQWHILFSTLALILYFPILFMGWRLYSQSNRFESTKRWHRRIGILAFIFRSLGFVLMYSMIDHVVKG